jgi:hypothetical protein
LRNKVARQALLYAVDRAQSGAVAEGKSGWERYGNNPTHPGVRVAGWPPLSDPIYLNSPYNDSFVIMMLLMGQLHAV